LYHDTSLHFYFNHTATTEIYTLSLHDALPIWVKWGLRRTYAMNGVGPAWSVEYQVNTANQRYPLPALDHGLGIYWQDGGLPASRSEEHTSELQSRGHLVCRLLLEKKKRKDLGE